MNIPDDVVKAADDAYWRDGRVLDEYTVVAEWARKEVAAERDALRAENEEDVRVMNMLRRQRDEAETDRDALRAQLDAMTTEWATSVEYAYGSLDAPDIITPTGEDIDDLGSARYNAEEFWLSVLQRTVKRSPWRPWVEVNG